MNQRALFRKILLLGIPISVYLFFSSPSLAEEADFSPEKEDLNLLIITVDTLRADHVGIYGYKKIETPNMDTLGRNGVLFSRAFCHVPLTLPSHCSLFTGTLPLFHGVRDNGYRLPAFNITLAQILKDKGYQTAAFVGAFPLDSRFGLDNGFDVYDDLYGSKNIVRDLSFIERKAEEVNNRATEWIVQNKAKKFFVWVHYFDPHTPYDPPTPYSRTYANREYDGEIAYTDSVIGNLIEKLEYLRLIDHTLIVLTSDHGEGLGDHNETTHGIFVYDATLRVPLIFHNPRILPKNRFVPDQIGLIDVMPTVLDLMGFEKNPGIQGESFKSAIFKGKPLSDKFVYIESVAAMMDRNWAPLYGIRTEEWKYIDAPIPELYDLKTDPKEETNLVEKKPDITALLRQKLQTAIKKYSSSHSSHILKAEMDKETREKLISLGYITGRKIEGETERPDPKTMIEMDNTFNAAIIASETGKLETARLLYEQVLDIQPSFIMCYEYAAYNYYKMGKIDEAINLLEKAVKLKLMSNSLLARLGLYYQEIGRFSDSIDILERVTQQDDNYAEAFNYLGVSYFKSGLLIKSIDSFKKALVLDSDYAMAMNNLGNCYLTQKNYDLAEAEYKKAVLVDDQLAAGHNGLAVVFYRKGLIEKALLSWEKSLEVEPKQPDTLYNLGRVHLRLGNKQKSLQYLESFIKTASPQKYGRDIEEVKQVIERLRKEINQKK
ncbi:MAG: sulfatase-like hydrolase/transferase [Candidatus Aminicenantes bacterium]|nr:MAG: sulfatase-like hydrolase/transferase [Candidatus Aminicenantes bacterium]